MVLYETRFADRFPASGTEHEGVSKSFLQFRDLLSEQGHDPSLELYQAATSRPLRLGELPAAFAPFERVGDADRSTIEGPKGMTGYRTDECSRLIDV